MIVYTNGCSHTDDLPYTERYDVDHKKTYSWPVKLMDNLSDNYKYIRNLNQLNDDNVIRYIQYLFEDITTAPKGVNTIVPYEYADGTVIVQNLPASTDVVRPVTLRVTNLDGYLRDVQRD